MKGFVGLILGVMLGIDMVNGGAPQVPCFFIFGDSLSDNGNNNGLQTLARADFLPYGIDFPDGPTGRFSNGKNVIDVLATLLGFDHYIPPYIKAKDEDILSGVNYASGSAGIREDSGQKMGERISFRRQVENHKKIVSRVMSLHRDENATTNHLNKCIYMISIGNNDYLNNYFLPQLYPNISRYTPHQYASNLIDLYRQQLDLLYRYGARRFVLCGVGATGCVPNSLARASHDGRTCVEEFNSASLIFNNMLKSLVDERNNDFSDSKFIYGDSYGIFQDLLNNSFAYGFKVTNVACCGMGRNNGMITCSPGEKTCPNRKEFVFWDAFHPTEATNAIVAQRLYRKRSSSDAYPFDISTLAQL